MPPTAATSLLATCGRDDSGNTIADNLTFAGILVRTPQPRAGRARHQAMTAGAVTAGWPDPADRDRQPCADAEPEQRSTPETEAGGFDAFYGAAALRIVRYCYALTGNLADAQDIAQEAFARAWQRWASVSQCDAPEAWVRKVATNLAASRWRRDQTARAFAREFAGKQVTSEISPNTVALVAGLRTLPERQRVVLVLHYLADLPVDRIAADLGCPPGSVKAWLSRGRAALALAISETAESGSNSGGA
jgi:RNA polymerase sigma-70 factor, ECF subfamily